MQQLSLLETIDTPPVQYWPGFLTQTQAYDLLEKSLDLEWQHNSMSMFGKPCLLPRLETMFGDSTAYHYVYSGSVELRAKPWPRFLKELWEIIEGHTGYSFQVCIGNQYRNGQDSIGYHSDDGASIGERPAIASVSLGATRTFRIKKKSGGQSYSYDLGHGDLLVMLPGCQEHWVHAIPKSTKASGVRINWTFRPYFHT
jgi:alkylated DNA repair dioxygenase AlkB